MREHVKKRKDKGNEELISQSRKQEQEYKEESRRFFLTSREVRGY